MPELVAAAGAAVGLRTPEDVAARITALAVEARTPPLDAGAVARIEAVLGVAGTAADALAELRGARARPRAARRRGRPAGPRGWRRWRRAGSSPATLRFEASFGRTTLEYYDGFVFGALPRGRPDLPPIASGGRYDALTRALGHGRGIPAVGGMLRPEALVALTGGAAC